MMNSSLVSMPEQQQLRIWQTKVVRSARFWIAGGVGFNRPLIAMILSSDSYVLYWTGWGWRETSEFLLCL